MLISAKGQKMYIKLSYDNENGLKVDTTKLTDEQVELILYDTEVRVKMNLAILDYIRGLEIPEDDKFIMIENFVDKWVGLILASFLNEAFNQELEEDEEVMAYA